MNFKLKRKQVLLYHKNGSAFDPNGLGAREATVEFASDDSDENPYQFLIQGTGIAPEMDVTGLGVSIPDINPVPTTANDTDYTTCKKF